MKKPQAVTVLLLFLALIVRPVPARSCSIATSIFRDAVEAEAIVLARIDGLEDHELGAVPAGVVWSTPQKRTAARLRVLEVWKGDPPATLEVDFGESQSAASWKAGETLVLFLRGGGQASARAREAVSLNYQMMGDLLRDHPELALQDSDFPASRDELETMLRRSELASDAYAQWMTNRFSLREAIDLDAYPEEADRDLLRELVRLAAELPARGDVAAARLDWHVRAAERRVTRKEGLYDLSWLIDLPTEPYEVNAADGDDDAHEEDVAWDDEDMPSGQEAEPLPALSRDQLRRLAEGFSREPAVGESDVTMLRLLRDYPDLEVDRAAASVIEGGLLLRPIPRWVLEMIDEALKRYGDDFADRIGRDDVDARGRPITTGEGENTLPTIWEVARRDLGIPSVLPAVPPARASAD